MAGTALRIDRLLWFLRLAPSRSQAQLWVESGHFRLNGQRVVKAAQMVRAGDVLTLPPNHAIRSVVQVIEIMALPERRGPAVEAASCYRDIAAARSESDSQHGEEIDGSAPADLGVERE